MASKGITTPAEDKRAVRSAVRKFNAAALAGDQAALEALLSKDLFYGHSNALMENKAQCVANLMRSKIRFVDEPGSTVQVYGRTAIFHSKTMAHNTAADGQVTIVPLDLVQVWVRERSGWVMVARHTTRLPQA